VPKTKKSKSLITAKMAKVDGLEWLLFQKLLIMVQLHTTQMDNAICFFNNGTTLNYHKYSRFMRLYCTYFKKNNCSGAKVLLV
jgi:hypothetical protein